jgi:hypothetical protein
MSTAGQSAVDPRNDKPPLEERPESETDLAHQEDVEEVDKYVPEGYKDVEEFLKEAREAFKEDVEKDKDNREKGLKDLEFLYIDQWDSEVRADREAAGRPCFTVNSLPQFVGQVVGDRRMNRTSIRVVPKTGATKEQAEIRAAIIRGIEANSKADRVYDAALEDQVGGGIGNFKVIMDYAADDTFEQDIYIRQIGNAFAVVWDWMSLDPTGKDARRAFLQDIIPRKDYEKQWGDKHPIPIDLSGYGGECGFHVQGWVDSDTVRVTEYWQLKHKPIKIVMLQDGNVVEWSAILDPTSFQKDKDGNPVIRDTVKPYVCMHLITGFSILEGPYELPIKRIPIFRVSGRIGRVGDRQVRFGLIRWAREPAQMRNFWRSNAIETLAMAPKNQYLAEARSVKGREQEFREAHLNNDPLLIHNDGTPAPKREGGPTVPAAVLQESAMNTQDIKDVTGLQDASLGVRSNEVSGKAIMARQREGDVATITYHDHLNAAIVEAGEVISDLLPVCYDTKRVLNAIGQDDVPRLVTVNDPENPEAVDLNAGKFGIEIITGPSYTTQRMFAAEAMLEAIKVAPQLMEIAGDIIVEEQDWPGAAKLAERLKKAMPKELTTDPNKPPTPQELQEKALEEEARQVEQAMKEEQAEHATMLAQLEIAEKEAAVEKAQEEARKMRADADKAESDAERAELELGILQIEEPARIMATGGRPQTPSEGENQSARNSGSKSGRQSRRPKPRKR